MSNQSTTDDLVLSLPAYFPKEETSGNYKLLDVIAESIDRLTQDIETVERAMTLQDADDEASIDRIADIVGTSRREGESVEKYRMRTLLAFQSLTLEGTISDMLISFASILRADESEFWYQDWAKLYGVASTFALLVPPDRVADSILEPAEIKEIASLMTPAAKSVEVQYNGTFRPVSVDDYLSGNYDPDAGFGTIDEHGNPDTSGGTFGGLIQ